MLLLGSEVAQGANPKQPSNDSTKSKFTTGRKMHGKSKTLRRELRNTYFLSRRDRKTFRDSEKLRRCQDTTSSSAVAFLVWKGPLG